MKKTLLLTVLVLACACCASAAAAPALTDGETTGWIADNNYLYLQSPNGTTAQLPMEMDDLLQITDEELICLAKDHRIIAVKKDASGSRVVTDADAASLKDPRTNLENGVLTVDGKQISSSASAAATDGVYLYTVDKVDQTFVLRVSPVRETGNLVLPGTRDAYALALTNKTVSEPADLTVTKDALTLTGTDHMVTVMNLITGETSLYPAWSAETAAACVMNNTLYRYRYTADQRWVLETNTALVSPTPVPTPTPAPTPTPTPTQRPVVTPTPYNGYDDDGTIYYGASGKTVRKIQARLADLGYPVGKVDGKYGEDTQLAINLFCDAIHVREHRYITLKVQNKLMSKKAPEYDPYLELKKGDQGVSVLYMQRRLKELGYDPGKQDGVYGKKTVEAVAKYQKDHKIKRKKKEKPGEVASSEMLEMLYGPDPTPTPKPTDSPTGKPTATPTNAPTSNPSDEPTGDPTSQPDNPATQTDL